MTIPQSFHATEGRTTGFPVRITSGTTTFGAQTDEPATVIHVDDEPDFAEMTKVFLERLQDNFEVVTESSAADALETLEEDTIHGIISDYQMPRMDGLELLEVVREDYPDLPFILCTARGSEEVASDAIAAGVTDYIQKGSDTKQYEVLANRVSNAIEQYQTRQQLWETMNWSSQLMEQSLVGVYIVQDSEFVYVNEQFADIFGYDPNTLVSEPPSTLSVETPDKPSGGTCLDAVPPGTETARYESHGQTKGNDPIEFVVEVSNIDFEGSPAVLGVVKDAGDARQREGEP